jgi:SAM-dependent MidA family methyltransferase
MHACSTPAASSVSAGFQSSVSTIVLQTLRDEIGRSDNCIPFDRFMAIALHDPLDGYYARNIPGIGSRGDFTTAPQRTTLLGKAVARWLRDRAGSRRWKNFTIIECGPGDGSLAAAVLADFGWWERRRIAMHLVETSEPLRRQQEIALRGRRAQWHADINSALAACDGRALIYHNEFFDAFPCRIFERNRGDWLELHLRVKEGKLGEFLQPPGRPLPVSEALGRDWPEGQRVEIFESVNHWLRSVSGAWREGTMLAIDYGGSTDTIYHRRPRGTLRAYRQHQRLAEDAVYELPGRQDITADVNFEDIARWVRELGWSTGSDRSLAELAPGSPGAESFRYAVLERV